MKGKSTLNKTGQRKAITRVFSLVKSGESITRARKIVADELNLSPSTILGWQTKFKIKTPHITKTTSLIRGANTRQVITSISKYSFNDISNDARTVMRSIVNQDGRYTVKEANVVGKFMSNEISKAKLQLEVHKHNTKLAQKTNNNNLLQLT